MGLRMCDQKPHRKYQLTLIVGADDYDELLLEVDRWADMMYREYPNLDYNFNGVRGGPDSGATYDIVVDPEMTHDRYFEQVNAWIEGRKNERVD